MTMSLHDRAESYLRAFPQCADAVWVAGGGRWLYGVWQIGQDYRNASRYYGAYPHGFLKRVLALYPDVPKLDGNPECPRQDPACLSSDGECHDACEWPEWPVLHAFSGSLPPGDYARLDLNPQNCPEFVGNIYNAWRVTGRRRFDLVIADPPYTAADAEKYKTPAVNRGKALSALAKVTKPGGHLVWLDTTWPMHRKAEWHYYGAIQLIRSTNHRVRLVSLFERKAA